MQTDRQNERLLIEQLEKLDSVSLQNGNKGYCLQIDNEHSHCLLSLFGAHVLSFMNKHDQRERLWLSQQAIFDSSTPIRGGIPLCWPWFGPHSSEPTFPSHGFARTQNWQLSDAQELLNDDGKVVCTTLSLTPTKLDMFGYDGLRPKLLIECAESLSISLITLNTSNKTVALSQALHSYFLVDSISKISIDGINTHYADKVTGSKNVEAPVPYLINAEVDRIHTYNDDINADDDLMPQHVVLNMNNKPFQHISQTGHNSIVVWNPWQEKSANMRDMEQDAFNTMLCIEAANTQTSKPFMLAPNHIHKLTQVIY